jgi:hypothetical protein
MRTLGRLVLATVVILGATGVREAHARASGAPADSAGSGILARAPAATPSATSIARVGARVGDRNVRVWAGTEYYEISHARFDSTGVVFAEGDRLDLSHYVATDEDGPALLGPPVAWDRIDRIAAAHTHAGAGALIGALAAGGLLAAAIAGAEETGPGVIGAVVLVPLLGAGTGALVGGMVPRWVTVWERPVQERGR